MLAGDFFSCNLVAELKAFANSSLVISGPDDVMFIHHCVQLFLTHLRILLPECRKPRMTAQQCLEHLGVLQIQLIFAYVNYLLCHVLQRYAFCVRNGWTLVIHLVCVGGLWGRRQAGGLSRRGRGWAAALRC